MKVVLWQFDAPKKGLAASSNAEKSLEELTNDIEVEEMEMDREGEESACAESELDDNGISQQDIEGRVLCLLLMMP